jgi:hypothetical protein
VSSAQQQEIHTRSRGPLGNHRCRNTASVPTCVRNVTVNTVQHPSTCLLHTHPLLLTVLHCAALDPALELQMERAAKDQANLLRDLEVVVISLNEVLFTGLRPPTPPRRSRPERGATGSAETLEDSPLPPPVEGATGGQSHPAAPPGGGIPRSRRQQVRFGVRAGVRPAESSGKIRPWRHSSPVPGRREGSKLKTEHPDSPSLASALTS